MIHCASGPVKDVGLREICIRSCLHSEEEGGLTVFDFAIPREGERAHTSGCHISSLSSYALARLFCRLFNQPSAGTVVEVFSFRSLL